MVDSFEIITVTGSQKFYKPIKIYSVTNAIDEIMVSMIFLWLHSFMGRSLKERELFPDRTNKNHPDLILGSHGRNLHHGESKKATLLQMKQRFFKQSINPIRNTNSFTVFMLTFN